MASNTATYDFLLPTVGGDTNLWGGFLNSNFEDLDDLLDGTSPVDGIDIDSGSIDGTPIGASSASSGMFTPLIVNNADTITDPEFKVRRTTNDTQYIGIAGDASGNYIVSESTSGAAKTLYVDSRTNGVNRPVIFQQDGTEFARVDDPASTTAQETTSLLRRSQADDRYLTLSGGTLTGSLIIANTVPRLLYNDTNQPTDETLLALRYTTGTLNIEALNDDETVAATPYTFNRSGDLGAASSVVTRSNGDARYLRSFPDPDFEGAESNLNLGGTVSWSHGLGSIPTFYKVVAICKVASGGYAVGDEIPLDNGMCISSRGFSSYANATSIVFAAQSSFRICAANLSEAVLSSPNFKLVARAWG